MFNDLLAWALTFIGSWPPWVLYLIDRVGLAILVGLATSAIFFAILSRYRPRIDVSPCIARGKATRTGLKIFRIKVINRTPKPIIDIRAQLHIFKNHQAGNGYFWKSTAVALVRSDPIAIDRYDKSDTEADYAYRFVTYDDLDSIWDDDNVQFLRFRIVARHSVSGFGSFCSKDYRLKRSVIRDGEFLKGDTFEIE